MAAKEITKELEAEAMKDSGQVGTSLLWAVLICIALLVWVF